MSESGALAGEVPSNAREGPDPAHSDAQLRTQLARLQALLALPMLVTDSGNEEDIVRVASTLVPSLGRARIAGVYLLDDAQWHFVDGSCSVSHVRSDVAARLAPVGADRRLDIEGVGWAWAYALRSIEGHFGFLVVEAAEEVPDDEQFVLRVLSQQIGIMLASAGFHREERARTAELRATNAALATANAALERSAAIHARLMQVSVSGTGQQGIVDALHEVTRLPVVIEDRYGNVCALAGADHAGPSRAERPEAWGDVVQRAARSGNAIRDGDRLLNVAQAGPHALLVLALIDPAGVAGPQETTALEYGTTVLAVELARLRSVEEAELRLGRDLVEELLLLDGDADRQRIETRAQLLGYDLERPHRVIIADCPDEDVAPDDLFHAVRRAARDGDVGSLVVARQDRVVVLAKAERPWERFCRALEQEIQGGSCRIGMGGAYETPGEFNRSYREAELALRVQPTTRGRIGVVLFEELGVYQLLAEAEQPATVDRFIRRWIGALLDYDTTHGAELVATLSCYLECGGNYQATAGALGIHRSSLQYRLQRIRDISGHDLSASDERFNLQLATRALRTLRAIGGEDPLTPS